MSEWQPIETAPGMITILLFAITDADTGNWKMATGFWNTGRDTWEWDGYVLKEWDQAPTHWMSLPEPPAS